MSSESGSCKGTSGGCGGGGGGDGEGGRGIFIGVDQRVT